MQTSIRQKSNDLPDENYNMKVSKKKEIMRLRKMIDEYSMLYLKKHMDENQSKNRNTKEKYKA